MYQRETHCRGFGSIQSETGLREGCEPSSHHLTIVDAHGGRGTDRCIGRNESSVANL